VHILAFAVSSVLSGEPGIVNKIKESELAGIADEDHIAAGSTVTAVRSAFRNIGFPPETAASVAAVAGFDRNNSFVDKHDCGSFRGGGDGDRLQKNPTGKGRAFSDCSDQESRLFRDDGNNGDVFSREVSELDGSVRERKERMISAASDVLAGADPGAALADDDAAGCDELTTERFDTEHFRLTVAAVSAA